MAYSLLSVHHASSTSLLNSIILTNMLEMLAEDGTSNPSRSICLLQHQPWDSITSNPSMTCYTEMHMVQFTCFSVLNAYKWLKYLVFDPQKEYHYIANNVCKSVTLFSSNFTAKQVRITNSQNEQWASATHYIHVLHFSNTRQKIHKLYLKMSLYFSTLKINN